MDNASRRNTGDGKFVWHDLSTRDAKAAIAFYGAVVGWKTQPFGEQPGYTMWVGSQGPLGGVMEQAAPAAWLGHVQVADVDETAGRVEGLGGKLVTGPSDIPTVGRFAVIADPQGAMLSLFTPSEAMELHDMAKPGEVCWNELNTSDMRDAFAFYAELLGWQALDDLDMGEMGTYRIYGVGETALGGMMTNPKESDLPPSWVYYVGTDDLEAAIARAKSQGGTLMMGPMEVPDGGRVAQLRDPQGAIFALNQPPAANQK